MRHILLSFLLLLCCGLLPAQPPSLQWQVGYAKSKDAAVTKFVPAAVPGAVQLDIAKAEKYGPYYYGENWKDYLWMEDQYYTYKTHFPKPALPPGERLYFISKGIDYQFDIFLNDEKIFSQEGMFTWVKLDITDKLKPGNELKIRVYQAPKMHAAPADRTQAANVVKPAVSYLWDWHPRLIPLGIWDDTYLELQPAAYTNDLWVNYTLNDKLNEAAIDVVFSGRNLPGNNYSWKLLDANQQPVLTASGTISAEDQSFSNTLKNPKLWWPHDYGKPYLYQSVFDLKNSEGKTLQTLRQKVGFRRVKLVMNEGAWNEPSIFPKSRSVAPAQFEVNGVKIFAKGSNWVNPEIFPGIITKERYAGLVDNAVKTNFNIFRVWGGGIVNKESFFDLCDEKGIMVWQEFPLACNNYPDDPHYLKILEQEAISIIQRLKKHASLALWSGGNELFNNWSGMTDQSLALRLLNSLTLKLNASTPFIPTSPVMGMGHGHYVFRDPWTHEEVYALMARAKNTAYTEFGMPSPASTDILKKIIPANELWPPKPGTSWESHHAFKAWVGNTWLMDDMLADYFGPAKNLEELVAQGQLVQCEGYKAIFEEARRQKPYCAMALNWCYNEPWYTAANNSLISYPNTPKPALNAVRDACRPFCTSAKISKFKWKEGEAFTTQVWLLNDLLKAMPRGRLIAKIVADGQETELLKWDYQPLVANTNMAGPVTAPFKLPYWKTDRFKVVVEVEGQPQYRSEYTLLYQAVSNPAGGTKVMNQ